jgi:hypothetical protein
VFDGHNSNGNKGMSEDTEDNDSDDFLYENEMLSRESQHSGEQDYTIFISSEFQGNSSFTLPQGEYLVGSGLDCDIILFDNGVSEHHIRLSILDDLHSITDVEGQARLVNGSIITSGTLLPFTESIVVGKTTINISPVSHNDAKDKNEENNDTEENLLPTSKLRQLVRNFVKIGDKGQVQQSQNKNANVTLIERLSTPLDSDDEMHDATQENLTLSENNNQENSDEKDKNPAIKKENKKKFSLVIVFFILIILFFYPSEQDDMTEFQYSKEVGIVENKNIENKIKEIIKKYDIKRASIVKNDNLYTLGGYVKNPTEKVNLNSYLFENNMPVKMKIYEDSRIQRAVVAAIKNYKGLALEPVSGGAVSLKGHVIDRQEYDTIIKEIKLGLPMISVFTVDNIKILSENTESLDGDTKVKNSNRVELRESMYIKEVWAGDNSYIVTLDNKRYWENSILPGGHVLISIQIDRIVVKDNKGISTLKLVLE